MDLLWSELTGGIPMDNTWRDLIRCFAQHVLGAAIGYEREKRVNRPDCRTHILVTAGTTVFILGLSRSRLPTNSDAISRVIQGIITGIGFVGAGSIMKRETEKNIQGITTSAGIWMTAAIGITIGLGGLGLAILRRSDAVVLR
jgi:putative Mg2+ transporter-C (MgtC) family protein